ncbi:MAG: hypothetical protein ACRDH6_08755 [Actinomycetota bacterium]
MNKLISRSLLASGLVTGALVAPARATHDADLHSENMSLVAH